MLSLIPLVSEADHHRPIAPYPLNIDPLVTMKRHARPSTHQHPSQARPAALRPALMHPSHARIDEHVGRW